MPSSILTEKQTRVIGAMIEKQMTTPMGYPMTINAIRVACNQKSNRDPVVEYIEDEIFDVLEELRRAGYAEIDTMEYSRSTKYRQTFGKALDLERGEVVILCELFNRGAQTPGELRSRCERMYKFKDLADVELCLHQLSGKKHLVMLERSPGMKEHRWAHLFCGEPKVNPQPATSRPANTSGDLEERVAFLENQVRILAERIEVLEQAE